MIEAHFAVPMAGAVLNTLNTRLDAKTIAFMLEHAETKVLLVDPEFVNLAREALSLIPNQHIIVIDVADEEYEGENQFLGSFEYEEWLAQGDANFEWQLPEDEWDAISLNYTSGTTGNPKASGLSPPRCIFKCSKQYFSLWYETPCCLFMDTSSFSL